MLEQRVEHVRSSPGTIDQDGLRTVADLDPPRFDEGGGIDDAHRVRTGIGREQGLPVRRERQFLRTVPDNQRPPVDHIRSREGRSSPRHRPRKSPRTPCAITGPGPFPPGSRPGRDDGDDLAGDLVEYGDGVPPPAGHQPDQPGGESSRELPRQTRGRTGFRPATIPGSGIFSETTCAFFLAIVKGMDVIGFSSARGSAAIPSSPCRVAPLTRNEESHGTGPAGDSRKPADVSLFRSLPLISLIWRDRGYRAPVPPDGGHPFRDGTSTGRLPGSGTGGRRIPARPPPGGASPGRGMAWQAKSSREATKNATKRCPHDPAPDRVLQLLPEPFLAPAILSRLWISSTVTATYPIGRSVRKFSINEKGPDLQRPLLPLSFRLDQEIPGDPPAISPVAWHLLQSTR